MTPEEAWRQYYENTKGSPPRELLVKAVPYVLRKKEALDLGAGAFNDVRYLLEQGFEHVTALDKVDVAGDIMSSLPKDRVDYVISTFEAYEFPKEKYDLVSGQYSFPFIPKHLFDRVFTSILASVKPGGVITGQFFGVLDDWNVPKTEMTFHTRDAAEDLLKGLSVIEFNEEETDKPTARGEMKHWHVFNFIAVK
jgi:tellurite methyltransferase